MTNKPHFSCVFAFFGDEVLLVQKNHPEWQAGRWNGIGGQQNDGETPEDCARREFKEETGVGDLQYLEEFMVLEDTEVIVHFFKAQLLTDETGDANDKGETLMFCDAELSDFMDTSEYIDNLCWLIPMACVDKFHVSGNVTALRRGVDGEPV